MPWWIWLLLALFMLAMIVAGIVYAAVHGIRGLKTAGEIGSRIGDRLAAMQDAQPQSRAPQAPVFTEPLQTAADRYAQAQSEIITRQQATRERHARTWARWNRS
ncbi:hypothetical protein [Bifidobacterium biavatii]|uniref:Uncharacterized protein n=1 Tax=Bifidobacterium biavatii DSM 23969 TaxID=1437608 RepID=A0A086ZYZ5_9BIFI|nr:hypothetical protein [Bifidobacterium biavatii]KFI51745.1 hypothetical protein BBIA_0661 [Bifidobacterium biavatii DSM 23969]